MESRYGTVSTEQTYSCVFCFLALMMAVWKVEAQLTLFSLCVAVHAVQLRPMIIQLSPGGKAISRYQGHGCCSYSSRDHDRYRWGVHLQLVSSNMRLEHQQL